VVSSTGNNNIISNRNIRKGSTQQKRKAFNDAFGWLDWNK
jgi:hypothetical protein